MVEFGHLLNSVLAVGEFLVVGVDRNLFFDFLATFTLILGKFVSLSLRLGCLFSLDLLGLLLLGTLALVLLLGIDLTLLEISPVVLNISVSDVEGLLGVLDFLVDDR